MEATFLVGTSALIVGAASGLWGIVVAAANRKPQQPPQLPAPPDPTTIERAIERAMARKPDWEAQLEQALANPPEPDWHKDLHQGMMLASDVIDLPDRLTAALARPQPELGKVVAELVRANSKLDDLLTIGLAQPVFDFPGLEKLEAATHRLADAAGPLAELPLRLAQLIERMAGSPTVTVTPPQLLLGSGSAPPPQRRVPTPRAVPPAVPMPATTAIPAPYVGGTIVVPAGQPANLLQLIQQQLQPNCPGSSVELVLSAESSVFIGSASAIGGPLSDTNYAFELLPGTPRIYRSGYPGNSTPIGDLQVFATAAAELHVEVQT